MGARTPWPANGGGDWIVSKPEHWIFQGTGMKKGDKILGLVGWEFMATRSISLAWRLLPKESRSAEA